MELRNWIGIVIIVVGLILQPVGWMYTFWLQGLSFVLIVTGVFIFMTQKYFEKSAENEFGSGSGGKSGSGMPGDIYGNNGWDKGGRSESWNSDSGGDGGGD